MKLYLWFFIILTLAEMVFTLSWFLFIKKLDRIILTGLIIYSAAMIIGYITYQIDKYRKHKKELMDALPK
jgi:hypothetical protein